MKMLLRSAIVAVIVFASYAAFATSNPRPSGNYGPVPTCNCNPPSVK